jgi:hypothetical protein
VIESANDGARHDVYYEHLGNTPRINQMPVVNAGFSADETVKRAEALYNRDLRELVEADNIGRYIAIDIETGNYEIANDYHEAAHHVLSRSPGAPVGVLRIGYPTVGRIGGRVRTTKP